MIRILSCLALAAFAATGAPVAAQQIGYYVATPAANAKLPARLTTRGTPWFVRDGRLLAPKASETPARVCAMVAAKVGPLAGFSAGGAPFADEAMTACNAGAAAKAGAE